MTSSDPNQTLRDLANGVTLAIITALSHEFAAVKALIENPREYFIPGRGAGRRYWLGEVPAANGSTHQIVLLLLPDMGNNSAAIRATLLLEHFPQVHSIIMTGIAGGVPNPSKPDEHIRLGDIVISDRGGVVQYDLDKETVSETMHRHPPRPPSATLLEGIRYLEAGRIAGLYPWQKFIENASNLLKVKRPNSCTDTLANSQNPNLTISHPIEPNRLEGLPKINYGPIASANKLLKNPLKRDALRDKFGIKAVEMEGSGIADATWNSEVGYLVVRGICDYCDSHKGDAWQPYAAIVAAAYTRALLESIPNHQTYQKQFKISEFTSNTMHKNSSLISISTKDFKPIEVMIVYTSQDQKLQDEFEANCLSTLEREGIIKIWHKNKIRPGTNPRLQIEHNFKQSQLILPLISANFVHSYNRKSEGIDWQVDRMIRRLGEPGFHIIPILIFSAPFWQRLPSIGELTPLPKSGHPVSGGTFYKSKTQGFIDLAEELDKEIQSILNTSY